MSKNIRKVLLILSVFILIGIVCIFCPTYSFAIENTVEDALLKGDWSTVVKLLEQDDIKANNPVARLLMGHACLAINHNNESMLLFLSVNKQDNLLFWYRWTNSFLTKNKKNPIAHYLSGDAIARMGKLKEAKDTFTRTIRLKSDFALAYNARGIVNMLINKFDNALVDFYMATKFAPDLADAHANMGTLGVFREVSIDFNPGSLDAFNKAISLNPDFAIAYNGRGSLYFGSGKFEEAARDFSTALRLNPLLVVAEVNQELAFSYASKLITLAGIINEKPGTTLKSISRQYPKVLKERQKQYSEHLSHQKELINTNFAFKRQKEVSVFMKKHGAEKVRFAMGYDLERSRIQIAKHTLELERDRTTPEIKTVKPILTLDMANQLTASGFSTYNKLSTNTKGWSPYLKPFSHQIRNNGLNSNFSTNQELNRWRRELRKSAIHDVYHYPIETIKSQMKSAVLPSWFENIVQGFNISKSAAKPAKTPLGEIDKWSSIASLGGPMSAPLIPFLKSYYSIVFEALASSDIKGKMRSLDYNQFTTQKSLHSSKDDVILHITDFGIKQWNTGLKTGDDFTFTENKVFQNIPKNGQVLIVMPPDREFRKMTKEQLAQSIFEKLKARVDGGLSVGTRDFELQIVQHIGIPGYIDPKRQRMVNDFGESAYRAIGMVKNYLQTKGLSSYTDATCGSNGCKVLTENVPSWKSFLRRVSMFDGRAFKTPTIETINAIGEKNVHIYNTAGDWAAPNNPLVHSIGNHNVVKQLKKKFSGIKVTWLDPTDQLDHPFGAGHVAGMNSNSKFLAKEFIGGSSYTTPREITGAALRPKFPQRSNELKSQIPGFLTSTDRPLSELSDIASKINREIPPLLNKSIRTALIVGNDSLRTDLLQSEFHKFGFQTRVIPPSFDPPKAARLSGADVMVGIRDDFEKIKNRRDRRREIPPLSYQTPPPTSCPPFCGPPGVRSSNNDPPDNRGGGASVHILSIPQSTYKPNWRWGKTFTPTYSKNAPGGISTKEIASAFVDKGNWPVMTSFGLFYKVDLYGSIQKEL